MEMSTASSSEPNRGRRTNRPRWRSVGALVIAGAVVLGFYTPGPSVRPASAALTLALCPFATATLFFTPGVRVGPQVPVTIAGIGSGSPCISLAFPLLSSFTAVGDGVGMGSCESGGSATGDGVITWNDGVTSDVTGNGAMSVNLSRGSISANLGARITAGRFNGATVSAFGTGVFNPLDCFTPGGVSSVVLAGSATVLSL